MLLIDRYLARGFLSSYLILILIGIALYIVCDLLLNIDEFTGERAPPLLETLAILADFYGHKLPLYYSQLAGPATALAAAFTLGAMLRNNEMTGLVASGMPLHRLIAPLALCSVPLVALWVLNRELIVPRFAHEIARSHAELLERIPQGVFCTRDERNAILTAMALDPRTGRLEGVFLVEPDPRGLPSNLVEADAAVYDADRRTWVLERGRRLMIGDPFREGMLGDPIRYEVVREYEYRLTPADLALRQSAEWADLLSLQEMTALLRTWNLPNRGMVDMSRHVRLTHSLVQCVLLLLTVPFFLTREPGNVLGAGGRALLAAGLFFATTFIAQGTPREHASAALAAWMPILLFGPVAVLNIANIKT
jgi:lipopolysaccharide export system permease protein